MKNKLIKSLSLLLLLPFISCENNYSVFSGGTGGLIVDAESTSTPKSGIPNVDVYAYTDSGSRDSDFNNWKEGSVFNPSDSYYGHTSTDANGSFVLSNIVWKEKKPDFGKDADFTTIYLLYYHENYGLTKDETLITSDSTSDTVYAELTAVKKTTAVTVNIYDAASSNLITGNVLVKISVPQTTDTLTDARAKVYEQTVAGSGIINISYPRWKNADDKEAGIENTPEISITYAQSSDTITWKACANADNEAKNYAFFEDGLAVTKTIKNSTYSISLYGKTTRINLPTVNGTYGDTSDAANDGIIIRMKAKDSDGDYTIDCGEVTTTAQAVGTNGVEKHGTFSNLGTGFFFTDSTYTEKNKIIEVKFYKYENGLESEIGTASFRSDTSTYTVKLN